MADSSNKKCVLILWEVRVRHCDEIKKQELVQNRYYFLDANVLVQLLLFLSNLSSEHAQSTEYAQFDNLY